MKFPVKTVIIASTLFVLDAFVLNQGVVALIALFIALPVMLIRTIPARKDKQLLKRRFTSIVIYAVMAGLILFSNRLNNNLARKMVEIIIAACEQYKAKNNAYPDALSALVPGFLSEIPKAKYTFSNNNYKYSNAGSGGLHFIMYTEAPPFGRPYYILEEKRWDYMD